MSIWERVAAALAEVGLPVAESQMISSSPASLPDAYLVFFLLSDPAAQHADDGETCRSNHVQVSLYSRAGLAGVPAQVDAAMRAAGFTRGSARELPYNQSTRHYGLAMEYYYLD
jgi:hypothetical protein